MPIFSAVPESQTGKSLFTLSPFHASLFALHSSLVEVMQFTDEWLVPTMETLVAAEELTALRDASGGPVSLWETTVQKRLTTDERILSAAAERFRLPVADFSKLEIKVRESVPETLARRFNVLPLRITDRNNTPSPGGPGAGTTAPFAFGFDVPCTPDNDVTKNVMLYGPRAVAPVGLPPPA